jgi:4'-phosphopantetheinyl transferase
MNDIELSRGEAQIWWASLDVDQLLLERLRRLLSPAEIGRAGRFRVERAERRFIAARAALRMVLGRATGTDPAEIEFDFGEHGKPHLPGGPCFNASDSGDFIAVALATVEVGIDIENARTLRRSDRLAQRVCTPLELDSLRNIPKDERDHRLLRLWTCKEAALKAVGVGLPGGARNVEVDFSNTGSPTLDNLLGERTGWTLLFPEISPRVLCTLVVRGDLRRVISRSFDLQST